MLDPTQQLVFGIAQSIGAIATAIALGFLIIQTRDTRNQTKAMQHEIAMRLRPWIYRLPDRNQAFQKEDNRVLVQFNNTGQIAAHRVYYHYTFKKDEPEQTMTKKSIKDSLLNEKPIVRERLVFPNEEFHKYLIMDQSIQRIYTAGLPIFLHLLVRYKFSSTDDELEGSYIGVFRLKSSDTGISPTLIPDIEKEWAE
jgi:hypothetical protein